MRPMSDIVNAEDSDPSSPLKPDGIERSKKAASNDAEENQTNEPERNVIGTIDKSGASEVSIETQKQFSDVDVKVENTEIFVECQDSGRVLNHSSSEEVARQSSVECRDRLSSVESKSHPSTWSFSQWSEYESLEDERPVEDLNGDPQKLILWAAEKNELETLKKLLEEDPTLVNARDNDLYTPLHRASYSNNIEVIKMLLSYDANISSQTVDGWQPLHCACKWDSVEAVSLLLQNGADINARTKGQITPLHLAASNANGRRTLELLLWHPYVDPQVKTEGGDTAYDIANRTGPLGALFEILEESVNVY